jgi:isopenicillin N synthase-like dioxygenase
MMSINISIIKFLLVIFLIRLELLLSIDINDILKSNSTKSSDSCNVNIPIIDISSLKMAIMYRDKNNEIVKQIRTACTETGFFYISNHGVPANLIKYLEKLSRDFFGLSKDIKREISMDKGGHAWRGYFFVGEEVTSGIPDQKEGIYFGTQGDPNDDRPLHGVNLYPNDSMKEAVEAYMEHMKQLGELLMKAIVLSLGLDYSFVDINFQDPTELFRIFSYPPHDPIYGDDSFAVGTHSDYGFITILWQDDSGGLQVKPKGCSFRKDFWIDAQPVENTFVINLGDALEHLTGGYLTSTPHRVIQRQGADNLRISMPYFYDPSFDTPMTSILSKLSEDIQKDVAARRKLGEWSASQRWDQIDPTKFQGTYGDYLKNKISKVFPHLYETKIKAIKERDIKSRFFNLLNNDLNINTEPSKEDNQSVDSTDNNENEIKQQNEINENKHIIQEEISPFGDVSDNINESDSILELDKVKDDTTTSKDDDKPEVDENSSIVLNEERVQDLPVPVPVSDQESVNEGTVQDLPVPLAVSDQESVNEGSVQDLPVPGAVSDQESVNEGSVQDLPVPVAVSDQESINEGSVQDLSVPVSDQESIN